MLEVYLMLAMSILGENSGRSVCLTIAAEEKQRSLCTSKSHTSAGWDRQKKG